VLKIAYTTNEYIKVPLTEWAPSVADPTALGVELAAITGSSDPIEADWVTAAWVTESGVVKAQALWSALVAIATARTTYAVWMRVTATPEVPVLHCGTIQTR
jgi:hypothetical protein